VAKLAAGYIPLPGIPDEFIVPTGARARIGCGFSTSSWSFPPTI